MEEVEIAMKQAMIRYPAKVENLEAKIFESDYVKGDARFKPPHKETQLSNGYRYRIVMRLLRGRADEQNAVKVIVLKKAELARDFFSEPELVGSDGLEEQAILYRVAREFYIARAIKRAQEKSQQH